MRQRLQTIFYPFMYASLYGNGKTLRTITESETYVTSDKVTAPYIASSVIYNPERDEVLVYAVNRSLNEDMELELELQGFENYKLVEHTELYSDDLKAINDKDVERVAPTSVEIKEDSDVILKKHSWNMLRYEPAN